MLILLIFATLAFWWRHIDNLPTQTPGQRNLREADVKRWNRLRDVMLAVGFWTFFFSSWLGARWALLQGSGDEEAILEVENLLWVMAVL